MQVSSASEFASMALLWPWLRAITQTGCQERWLLLTYSKVRCWYIVKRSRGTSSFRLLRLFLNGADSVKYKAHQRQLCQLPINLSSISTWAHQSLVPHLLPRRDMKSEETVTANSSHCAARRTTDHRPCSLVTNSRSSCCSLRLWSMSSRSTGCRALGLFVPWEPSTL